MWGLGFAATPVVLTAASLSASKKPVRFSSAPEEMVRSAGRVVPKERRCKYLRWCGGGAGGLSSDPSSGSTPAPALQVPAPSSPHREIRDVGGARCRD